MENIMAIVMQATEFLLVFHVMSCIWIRLAIYNQQSWIYSKFDINGIFYQGIENHFENVEGNIFDDSVVVGIINEIYYDAYYYMSTTMSCIGYGDITPVNTYEKAFVIVSELVGMFCFGRI